MSNVKKKEETNEPALGISSKTFFFSHYKVLSVKISKNQMLRKKNKQRTNIFNTCTHRHLFHTWATLIRNRTPLASMA